MTYLYRASNLKTTIIFLALINIRTPSVAVEMKRLPPNKGQQLTQFCLLVGLMMIVSVLQSSRCYFCFLQNNLSA